jgi:hypothetical protein
MEYRSATGKRLLPLSPQNERIVMHFEKHGSLTPLSALVNLGVARLASRIDELRQLGAPIHTNIKRIDGKKYAEYVWSDE